MDRGTDRGREEALRFVVSEYAHLLADNAEAFEGVELVLPTNEHFPDAFENDAESVEALLARMMAYTPLAEDLEVALGFVDDEAKGHGHGGGGCGSGACGTGGGGGGPARLDGVVDEGHRYRALVHVQDTANPARLTTALARSVGAVLLCEAGEEQDQDVGAKSEVWAAAAGLGPLLLNGAHVFAKSCGGVRVHQGTALSLEELSFMTALFCRVNKLDPRKARGALPPTQREALDEAVELVDANEKLVRTLRRTPELLADGVFELEAPKGLLGRLFRSRDEEDAPAPAPASKRPATRRSDEEQRRLDEARALVEEAFGK